MYVVGKVLTKHNKAMNILNMIYQYFHHPYAITDTIGREKITISVRGRRALQNNTAL